MTEHLKKLQLSDFESRIGEEFVIKMQDEDGNQFDYTLELIEAEALGVKERDVANLGRESFALHFRNPDKGRYLNQQIYPLQHEAFENLALFLVPMGPDDNGMVYEVIFT
jgi:hypothetical protein